MAWNGERVHVTCSRCCCSNQVVPQLFNAPRATIMENRPPYNLARRHSSLMHSRHLSKSKSSPAKRDATRILAPQSNHAVVPSDAFDTGLLTPQASQNTFDSDAATSLISPPPEDSGRAGVNHHVRVALPVFVLTNRPIFGISPHGPDLIQNPLRIYDTAVHLSASDLLFRPFLYLVVQVNLNEWQRQVPIRNPTNRPVELAWDRT